jgi:regulator of sirC expression with transglutaminase-like and TPR domain
VLSGHSTEARVGALAGLIHARFGYRGDSDNYDDLDNANLIRVIERRRGLPVALGVLWLHCIRAAGWDGHGVDFPGHFLIALEKPARARNGDASRHAPVLIDAFGNGATLATPELLALLRRINGSDTPLRPGMVRPMATRDVLLRLQRNLVQRRLQAGDMRAALGSLEGMLQIAPDIAANWLNAADLNRHLGRIGKAIECLERFLALVPESQASIAARAQLDALRGQAS